MVFDLKKFVDSPNWDELDKLKKADKVAIGGHYGITFEAKARRGEILNTLVEKLVDKGIVPELEIEVSNDGNDEDDGKNEVRLNEMELEKCKFPFKMQEMEHQHDAPVLPRS
jgi:hypothetical protein